MHDREPYLSSELRAALRAPVAISAGARARVMQRVREAAVRHPRGSVRPALLGALLAASFVVAIISAGESTDAANRGRTTLADTIARSFEPPPVGAQAESPAELRSGARQAPIIDPKRIVAVADETSRPTPRAEIQTPK